MLDQVEFDDRGLAPCIAQDAATGEVLTLAYMSEESLRLTIESGEVHYFSRSRSEIWHKGATSGNTQRVVELRLDCDGDAILVIVDPAGPACHTGERTCFHRSISGDQTTGLVAHESLPALERTLQGRAENRPQGSYTVELLDDPGLAGAKVEEEAEEVVRAVREETDERVAEEAADLIYHLMVLLASRGILQATVLEVLNGRRS